MSTDISVELARADEILKRRAERWRFIRLLIWVFVVNAAAIKAVWNREISFVAVAIVLGGMLAANIVTMEFPRARFSWIRLVLVMLPALVNAGLIVYNSGLDSLNIFFAVLYLVISACVRLCFTSHVRVNDPI